jgi:BTB/POZ domain-containing protein 3/6
VALEPDNIETLSPGHCQPPAAAPVTASSKVRSPPQSPQHQQHLAAPAAGSLSTRDPNWQSAKCSVRERNAAMFNNNLMADIYFLVGQPMDSVKRYK